VDYHLPTAELEIAPMLIVMARSLMFLAASILIVSKLVPKMSVAGAAPDNRDQLDASGLSKLASVGAALLTSCSLGRWPVAPLQSFCRLRLGTLLTVLFLGVSLLYNADMLAVTSLVSILLLEHFWHFTGFRPEAVWLAAGWNITFSLVFMIASHFYSSTPYQSSNSLGFGCTGTPLPSCYSIKVLARDSPCSKSKD